MASEKLFNILDLVAGQLEEKKVPYALIGALALGAYGLPRYTADIDILAEADHSPRIIKAMQKLGYQCFYQTSVFAQFDSDMGLMGRVDFMFVATPEGKAIIGNSVEVNDQTIGKHPIIQPTDYVVLKLMAMANNPDRLKQDEADILTLLRLDQQELMSNSFDRLDRVKIERFATRFRLENFIRKSFDDVYGNKNES